MKKISYTQACAAVKHLLPDGCRFLKIGEPIPAGAKFIDETGKIGTNILGAARLAAFHCPHFINVELKTVSDKILEAFTNEIESLKRDAKCYAEAGHYELAGKYVARANVMDEALGIAMRAVRS